jgi:hypothetical protein
MGYMMSFVENVFRWNGFLDVLEGLRDDNASGSPWSHKGMVSRLEFDRDLGQEPAAA